MNEFFQQVQAIFLVLFDSKALIETLQQPGIFWAALVALNLIVFTETGLLVGFFLPGDSLLVTTGLVAYAAGWDLPLLIVTLCIAAIVGDSVGYWIGYRAGPKIFTREQSFFFRKDYLLKAQAFYERHGGKTIILARFVPIIRTFAPVVAGIGRMDYRKFLAFNVVGGIGWVVSMILLGYALTPLIDPPLKRLFGEQFEVVRHVEKVILIVVFLSITPGLYAWARAKFFKRAKAAKAVNMAA
jgi:membrane-associated protein